MKKTLVLLMGVIVALSSAAIAADGMVRCAYDGMEMKASVMKKATVKGETLYFCNDAQRKAYVKNGNKYRVKAKVGSLSAVVNFLTHKEHAGAMKAMGMEIKGKQKGTHHVSVYLRDAKGKDVKPTKILLRIKGPKGKAITTALMWMSSMTHYGADFDLGAKGNYKITVMMLHAGKQHQTMLKYHVK